MRGLNGLSWVWRVGLAFLISGVCLAPLYAQEEPKKEEPKKEEPKKEEPKKEEPKKEEPKKEEPKKEEPKKEEPKKEEPKKEEPKKEEPKKEEPKKEETPIAAPGAGSGAGPTKGSDKIKPFDKVITKEAVTSAGLFYVHRLEDKIFYEIPTSELGKEMLWVTQVEKTGTGYGYGGSPVGDRVVRWEQRDDQILLRDVKYQIRADIDDPIRDAVAASSVEPIIAVFQVMAYGKDKAPVVEVTSLFKTDVPEFSAKRAVRGSGIDSSRTFIEKVKAFPTNIETKVLATFRPGGGGGGPLGPIGPRGGGDSDGAGITAVVHHSMIKLPDEPMRPRREDDRIGFFSVNFQNFGNLAKQEVEEISYITRWRLEKKDPKAEVSEPKKPIVYYIGREVPAKWRPFIKKGVEAWQPAFEKAGFKNAIIAKDAPSPREDPDWDAEDARYSTIRWLPSTIENAMGPHVHDPRTGEILESDILMFHNVLKLARDWYFVQASPNDPRAQTLPLPDDLLGDLLAYVVSHEVGHTLGFPHNMKASSSYAVDQLRNKEFTEKNGVEASIMDYGRFNYVAQPGDNARLIPIIGPYDEFALEWGYREFPEAKTYEQEKAELDKITARQKDNPVLRFGDPNPAEDPSQQTEDLGSDAVAATELGLKNIDRVAEFLVKATCKPGENYDLLRTEYTQLLGQRARELGHVSNMVGGVIRNNQWFPDGTKTYDAVPADRQKAAVAFLNQHAFQVPPVLVNPDILQRLEPTGAADRILGNQRGVLGTLLNGRRVKRIAELALRDPEKAYKPADLINDLHEGIWSELKKNPVDIDLYRRNLQRAYLEQLAGPVENPETDSDMTALARTELIRIIAEIKDVLAKGDANPVTSAAKTHLLDIRMRAEKALDPTGKSRAPGGTLIFMGE